MVRILGLLILIISSFNSFSAVKIPHVIMAGTEITIEIEGENIKDSSTIQINNSPYLAVYKEGKIIINKKINSNEKELIIKSELFQHKTEINPIPLWLSVIPPLAAIILALILKEVLSSLFLGLFSGVLIIYLYHDGIGGIIPAIWASITDYIIKSLYDSDHLSIITFSMIIGGMVTLITKNGGMKGLVSHISKWAKTPFSGQLVTWFLGIIIFFDDYANTLVVGPTMRPVTDRLKVSREKLAYLVDSTAAPVVSIAFITTWIGAQLGYITDGINSIDGLNENAYSVFLNSLSYAFYPIFTLVFMLMLILMRKDFGPMYKAEIEARSGKIHESSEQGNNDFDEMKAGEPESHIPARAFNALIPIIILIGTTLFGLIYTGYNADPSVWQSDLGLVKRFSGIIGNANSYTALLWASISSLISALLLTLTQRILNLEKSMHAVMNGFKFMLNALLILVLAWSLSEITKELNTPAFITGWLSDIDFPFWLLPSLTFILAGLVAFSTGSSWSTMAILYPIILPAAYLLCSNAGIEETYLLSIFYNVVSAVLSGSVLGDHCSPISDTTILSSMASSCNHIQHVKTQMPYALTVGFVSVSIGTFSSSLGLPSWISFFAGFIILYLIIKFFGKETDPIIPAQSN